MSEVSDLLKRRGACGGTEPAQAWYNDLLGGTHWVGDKVLRAFGMGGLSDTLAGGEGDALPDWARTDEQKKAREADLAAQKKQEEQQKQAAEAAQKPHEEQQIHQAEEQERRLEQAQKEARSATTKIHQAEQHQREALDQIAQQMLSDFPGANPEPRTKPSRRQKPGQTKQPRERGQ